MLSCSCEKILLLSFFLLTGGLCEQLTNVKTHISNHRHKRQDSISYDYTVDQSPPYEYMGSGSNLLAPIGVAGGAGLALKALKAKSILKVLAGLAVLGGVLAAGVVPPAVIGSINLPFQGKRKKRSLFHGLSEKRIIKRILMTRRNRISQYPRIAQNVKIPIDGT